MNSQARSAMPQEVKAARDWLVIQGWARMPDWAFSDLCYVVPGIAAVWLFTSNSGLYWVENLVANPLIDKETRKTALTALVSYVSDEARKLGAQAVMTSTPHPGAARAYLAAGYSAMDTGCTQYVKPLGA